MGLDSTQDKYEFFKNADHIRIYKALKSVKTIGPEGLSEEQYLIKCNNRGIDGNAKEVCEKLNKAFKLLCSSESDLTSNKQLNSNDYKYLNFWANFELNGKSFIDNESIDYYKNNIINEINDCFSKEEMKKVFGDIEGIVLKRMKILDNLYQCYYEMHEIIFSNRSEEISNCSGISTQCVTQYKAAIDEFRKTKDNFYNALMKFEINYIKLHAAAVGKNPSFEKYIEKIPIEYKISELSFYSSEYETKKIILISLLCSVFAIISILIYFYKFTPFGTRMCARKRNKKKKFPTRDDTNNTLQCFDAFNHANTNNKMYNLAYNSV
ncbi:unnamed protein product [Plasmodium vivax]|uniref:(malaria parasite P. vivax) hypothetical protein n=1 Tax=Plasmodium vivax TaxID=5855 RepID=A0A8S4H714_PLAVI|nr:unnamed protein product [Plasmodium vivax]